jgi:hypothetical protein
MKIVIPTYDRSDRFRTIDFLKKNNIPNDWITIFVANEEEKQKYISVIGENYKMVVGELGICNQRNFITKYFEEGEYIISMDDDIQNITHKDDKPLKEWLEECINYLKDNNLGLLSVPPSSNPYFFQVRDKTISFKNGNYLAVGIFHIFKNHKDIVMDIDCLEDYDRSLMYLKRYGTNARYLDIFLKTVYWGKGGLSKQRTKEYYEEQVDKLLKKYPLYLSVRQRLIPQVDKKNKIPIVYIRRKKIEFS